MKKDVKDNRDDIDEKDDKDVRDDTDESNDNNIPEDSAQLYSCTSLPPDRWKASWPPPSGSPGGLRGAGEEDGGLGDGDGGGDGDDDISGHDDGHWPFKGSSYANFMFLSASTMNTVTITTTIPTREQQAITKKAITTIVACCPYWGRYLDF